MVACLKLGAVPVPCIEMLTAKDIAYRVELSGARAVIARAGQVSKFDGVGVAAPIRVAVGDAPGWHSLEALLQPNTEAFEPAVVDADDPAILYFTSGSTGQPKGVLHAARALYLWRWAAIHWLALKKEDIIWCTADTGWSKAGTSILFGPWSCGACAFFYDGPFDPAERLGLLETYAITVFCAPGTEIIRLLRSDLKTVDLSRLRRVVTAGEALSPVIVAHWHEATGLQIAEAYGQTESLMTLINTPDMTYRPGSMGKPLPGLELEVIDEQGALVGPDVEGDLAIRAPHAQLMLGYWQDPDRTQACYLPGADGRWFMTGDRAVKDAEGYFFHRGRRDDVINSSGYRIGPAEVEDSLLAHPAVMEVAVVGCPDPERGEVVAAFVVLNQGFAGDADMVAELQRHAKTTSAPYKYPRIIRFVSDLPKTPTGKIQRQDLRVALARRDA
jgi:acetyl-CoA synthetase